MLCTRNTPNKGDGICDGKGSCVSPLFNPCNVQVCKGKQCGDECTVGDIIGWCDARGNCEFNPDHVYCGKFKYHLEYNRLKYFYHKVKETKNW